MASPKISGPLVFSGLTALFLAGFIAALGDLADYLLPAVSFLILTVLFAMATVRLIWPGRPKPVAEAAAEAASPADG